MSASYLCPLSMVGKTKSRFLKPKFSNPVGIRFNLEIFKAADLDSDGVAYLKSGFGFELSRFAFLKRWIWICAHHYPLP